MISYPTGPNFVPLSLTCASFTEKKPYGRWIVNSAVSITTAMGKLTIGTKAPIKMQNGCQPGEQKRHGNAKRVENDGKGLRPARQFREAMRHESVSDDQAKGKGRQSTEEHAKVDGHRGRLSGIVGSRR